MYICLLRAIIGYVDNEMTVHIYIIIRLLVFSIFINDKRETTY